MSLSAEQNELLCRVEGSAPMGAYLQQNFWFPVALSAKLEPDGPPLLVKLLGRNYVLFRSTDGRLGFFNERCPHRGASLLLARNEGNGLRCLFHGWKYDVSGKTVEVPTEYVNPEGFCKKVPLKHYPVREAAGIVWTFIGEGEAAAFPDFEFMNLPADQVFAAKQTLACNWVQDVEGGMDSAHLTILHQHWFGLMNLEVATSDAAPVYEFEDTPGGYRYAAIRKLQDGRKYVRVSEFVTPWYCFIGPEMIPDGDRLVIMSTPVDDYNVIHWIIRYNPYTKLTPSLQNPAADPDSFPPGTVGGIENRWGQDRDEMMRGHFSGFTHLNTEDFAVAESQGMIADRSKEFLNTGDLAVVRMRKILLALLRENGGSDARFGHDSVDYGKVRAHSDIMEDASRWKELTA